MEVGGQPGIEAVDPGLTLGEVAEAEFLQKLTEVTKDRGKSAAFRGVGTSLRSGGQVVRVSCALPDRPLADIFSSTPQRGRWLAAQLRPFGIRPKPLLLAGTVAIG